MIRKEDIGDDELVKGCVAFERPYQELLYRRYARKMYSVCQMYSDNKEEAADTLQEGFIKVYKYISRFRSEGSLEGWIRRIMVNTAISRFRKKQKQQKEYVEYALSEYENEDTSQELFDEIDVHHVHYLIGNLPKKAQLVLKLYAIEGYDHREIAEKLNISEGTSKSQLFRARQLLKQSIMNLYAFV